MSASIYAGALRSLATHLDNTGEDLGEALSRVTPLDMELLDELAYEIIEYRGTWATPRRRYKNGQY